MGRTNRSRRGAKLALIVAVLGVALAGASDAAWAETRWKKLSGKKLGGAVTSRTLGFPAGVTVGFFADGRALKGWDWGRWWVEADQLCLEWPREDSRCYEVARRDIDLRFRRGDEALIGRYIDLN